MAVRAKGYDTGLLRQPDWLQKKERRDESERTGEAKRDIESKRVCVRRCDVVWGRRQCVCIYDTDGMTSLGLVRY